MSYYIYIIQSQKDNSYGKGYTEQPLLRLFQHNNKESNYTTLHYPVPTNQMINEYLKELADIGGIKTKITFHIARHTFATTMTLENGIPIDLGE